MSTNVVTYYLADFMTGKYITKLPLTQVSFSMSLNSSGRFQGTLNVEDPRIVELDWISATQPGRSVIWVDVNGVLVWGGIIWTRRYTMSAFTVELGANDFWSYFTQRVQAKDYSETWIAPEDPMIIAETVINDAVAITQSAFQPGTIPFATVQHGSTVLTSWVMMSYPYMMLQTVEMIVSQLTQMGYGVGFDLNANVAYVNGVPSVTLDLSYPRSGRIGSASPVIIDLETADEFVLPEDATQTGNQVYETSTSAGSILVIDSWGQAFTDGYPLLERLISHPDINSTPIVQIVLQACATGDLDLYAYPATVPTVTLPAFGDNPIGSYFVGDDARLVIRNVAGDGMVNNPRFPNGLDYIWRITEIEVTIADEGQSTSKLTFNLPPGDAPVRPPV